jgi:aarF domain-containing kinase
VTKSIFLASYGPLWNDFIEILDEAPIGVGAIAQVYRGRLKNIDQEVAIKTLHPGVELCILMDLIIMDKVAKLVSYIPGVEWLSLVEEVYTFGHMMRCQTDLRVEAQNLFKFRKQFRNIETIGFPKVYDDFVHKNVLVEEYISGISINTFLQLGPSVMDAQLARMGLDGFLVF